MFGCTHEIWRTEQDHRNYRYPGEQTKFQIEHKQLNILVLPPWNELTNTDLRISKIFYNNDETFT